MYSSGFPRTPITGLRVRLGKSMYLTGLHLRVPGGAPATYARDMRLFGAFPTELALPLRTAHVISAISSQVRSCYWPVSCTPLAQGNPNLQCAGSPSPPRNPMLGRCAYCRSHLTVVNLRVRRFWLLSPVAWPGVSPVRSKVTVPVPPARYLGHGCLHSWGSWSVVRAFACRSWIVDRGSWIVDRTKKCGQIRSIGYIVVSP